MFSPGSPWFVKLSGLVFKIRVCLGGPVAPICTINKTKSSSSCLQLELVLFYYLRSRNPRAVTRQHHENPPRPRPRPQHPRQVKRYSHLHPRQRRRQRHPMDERHRLVLLHLQRADIIRHPRRLSLPSCNKKPPRQAHQNWLFWQRSWLGRKLLSAPEDSMPGSSQWKLFYG